MKLKYKCSVDILKKKNSAILQGKRKSCECHNRFMHPISLAYSLSRIFRFSLRRKRKNGCLNRRLNKICFVCVKTLIRSSSDFREL